MRNVIALFYFVGSENPCIYSVPNRKQSYETTGFWHSEQSEDPKIIVPLLGKPLPPKPESEWENHRISVDVGEIVQFHHHAVKMQRTEDGRKLIGELNIQ